ncbi:MAG: hypothetical protein IKB83_00515, partial [Mycoplasmataceae bacterium]|nr:hypothetical protein [Mycoplasmataceae bacterium]
INLLNKMTELKTKKRSSYELPIKTNYLIFKNGRAKWIRTIEMTESKSLSRFKQKKQVFL